jgi:hypothetical protein
MFSELLKVAVTQVFKRQRTALSFMDLKKNAWFLGFASVGEANMICH